jgi:hypothetical protein
LNLRIFDQEKTFSAALIEGCLEALHMFIDELEKTKINVFTHKTVQLLIADINKMKAKDEIAFPGEVFDIC